jgi:hypothetical protein
MPCRPLAGTVHSPPSGEGHWKGLDLRFKLTIRDGRVLTGEIVGEVGPSILFRDDPGSGLLSIPINDLIGAYILDDSPLEIATPIMERSEPYYEMNLSQGDLIVSMDGVGLDRIIAEVGGRDLFLDCSGPDRSHRISIPLPITIDSTPSVTINDRVAEILIPLT